MKFRGVLLILMGSGLTHAQQIDTVTVTPNPSTAGTAVTIRIDAGFDPPKYCGMVIHFGTGETQNVKIDSDVAQFPVTLSHTYSAPGSYKVVAEGRTVTSHFPCVGRAETNLTIGAAATTASPLNSSAGKQQSPRPPRKRLSADDL